jgi:hypothetical protein
MRLSARLVFASLLVLSAVVLAVFFFSENSTPPRETELGRLVGGFMECLPESTTTAEREEIRGILDRFYDRAMSGKVDAQDVIEIQNDLRVYVTAGEIPDSVVFGFMSKVGKATRRSESGS